MKSALALDIDSTLTPPRQPIEREMAEALSHLRVPFYVAAGSHLSLLYKQFFEPLYAFGFRKTFESFLSNGAMHYHCDYMRTMEIVLISEFKIREYLGEIDYAHLSKSLLDVLSSDRFRLPPSFPLRDGRIVDRVSMINLCPIGRLNEENSEAKRIRDEFVRFDRETGYRDRMMAFLKNDLSDLIIGRQLIITLGGQTSFDIGIAGQDKTKPVQALLQNGFDRVIFIGDALFKGGNDAAINDFIKNWPSEYASPCPVEAIQIHSWHETIAEFRRLGFLP